MSVKKYPLTNAYLLQYCPPIIVNQICTIANLLPLQHVVQIPSCIHYLDSRCTPKHVLDINMQTKSYMLDRTNNIGSSTNYKKEISSRMGTCINRFKDENMH